jgi:microcystin-dependent protein
MPIPTEQYISWTSDTFIGVGNTFNEWRKLTNGIKVEVDNVVALIVNTIYPVGSLYITTLPPDGNPLGQPNTTLGVGTWTRFGNGRAIVGVDEGQVEFNTVEKTGGSKTHALTELELPNHFHSVTIPNTSITGEGGIHTHGLFLDMTGADANTRNFSGGDRPIAGSARIGTMEDPPRNAVRQLVKNSSSHTHPIVIPPFNTSGINAGGAAAHNNLQPYITTFIWKRTAL